MAQTHSNENYQQILARFLADIERVKDLHPREKYLYPILDTPIFSDVQTALMMAELDYRACEKTK